MNEGKKAGLRIKRVRINWLAQRARGGGSMDFVYGAGNASPRKWRCYMMKPVLQRIETIGAVLMGILVSAMEVMGAETASGGMPTDQMSAYRTIGLGVAAAVAISATVIGAAYAVGRIGSAALGAAAEKPELLTRSLLFVALAEGLAVLGFAIAMMLIQMI